MYNDGRIATPVYMYIIYYIRLSVCRSVSRSISSFLPHFAFANTVKVAVASLIYSTIYPSANYGMVALLLLLFFLSYSILKSFSQATKNIKFIPLRNVQLLNFALRSIAMCACVLDCECNPCTPHKYSIRFKTFARQTFPHYSVFYRSR